MATADGTRAYVSLAGKESAPGNEVVVVDVARRRELKRIAVGSYPQALALHPSGRFVLVTHRYTNAISVIDTRRDEVTSEIEVPFYCEDLVISPQGDRAYLSNFWKNQVLVVDLREEEGRLLGKLRQLGFDRDAFAGAPVADTVEQPAPRSGGIRTILRGRAGTRACHLEGAGGFYAGPDENRLFESAAVQVFPSYPSLSPLLRAVTPASKGGWADGLDGRHHVGGVVFTDPEHDPDYRALSDWIATGHEGPGISVGDKPRDLVLSPDGRTLYVANTASLDVSVIDVETLRETRRIYTRSPVNDLVWVGGRLVMATLGVGSGHPKAPDPERESTDPNAPNADFTLFRDVTTGKPLPFAQQRPLGPFDAVDGTAQEKFRDITNDIVIADASVTDVSSYRAVESFTRYTSDTFEALPGDKKGDVAAALMKVWGAFPEQMVLMGDRLYVTMSGTFEVQEWRVQPSAAPEERLVPLRVFKTGFKPVGIAVAGDTLVVADSLGETISFIDLTGGERVGIPVGKHPAPFPATEFELGEFFVQTSVFSVDQDQSCVHCHYRDTSDGKRWSVSQVMGQSRDGEERTGGSREVPDMRALFHKVPFFVEGTLSMDEPLTMIMEQNPLVDFQGVTPAGDFHDVRATDEESQKYGRSADTVVVATGRWQSRDVRLPDLMKRRELHFARISRKHLGREYSVRDFQRFVGAYQGEEPRLLANPEDPDDPMVRHGRALFESPAVGCAGCHPAPAFTDKANVHNQNRAFPPLVTAAARDNIHTLVSADRLDAINGYVRGWDPDDKGRVEENEGFFVAPSLRGLWAKPHRLLHHGGAISLREVVCPPDHPALRPLPYSRPDAPRPGQRERGLNERDGVPDTHGATSHLSVWDVECLLRYLLSIE
ncbi:MAG: hypothetical protein AB2A00_01375 [Myxococcota bacterium]